MEKAYDKIRREVKLYFNDSHVAAASLWQWCKDNKIPCSEYFARAAIEKFEREHGRHPFLVKKEIAEDKPKNVVEKLIDLAFEYEERGISGADITYKLPHMFKNGEISKETMAYLIIFIMKLKITIDETGNFAEILDEFPVDSKRDIQSKEKMDYFKKLLNLKLQRESQRHAQHEREKLKELAREEHERNVKREWDEWKKLHPDKPYWMKGLTEEEIEVSEKIGSGEWKVVGMNDYDDDDEEELQEYSNQTPNI